MPQLWERGVALMILFPVFFYPFSKTIFLAFDLFFRPPPPEDFLVSDFSRAKPPAG